MIEYYYLKFLGLNASKVFAKCYKFMYNIWKPMNYLLYPYNRLNLGSTILNGSENKCSRNIEN